MVLGFLEVLSSISLDYPLCSSVLIVLVLAYFFKWVKSPTVNYPAGPYGLPLVGYLPYLGKTEHLQLADLQQKYGKLFSLSLGMRRAVVMSDFKQIKEVYNLDEVSDRPPEIFLISHDTPHLVDTKDWKESRRFVLSTLRTLGMGKNKLEQVIMEQVEQVVNSLFNETGKKEFNVHNILYPAINNVIISLVCGSQLKDNPSFSASVDSFSTTLLRYTRHTALMFYLPILKPFKHWFDPSLKKTIAELKTMEQLLWKEIQKHEEDFDEYSLNDFMDYSISEMNKYKGTKTIFSKGFLNGNSQVLLVAGNDTTLRSIEWVLMMMAKYPQVQDKVYEEIIRTIGRERPPTWDDRDNMPYLDAVISESSRFNTIAPLADPHWTISDIKIGNYDVPKNTVIISNLHAVHFDPQLWDKPEEFDPSRFLNSEGKKIKDPEYLIPFSIGKRFCPGEKLARVEVFIFVGAILQKFKVLPPPGGIKLDSGFDIVVHPKFPIIRVEARN